MSRALRRKKARKLKRQTAALPRSTATSAPSGWAQTGEGGGEERKPPLGTVSSESEGWHGKLARPIAKRTGVTARQSGFSLDQAPHLDQAWLSEAPPALAPKEWWASPASLPARPQTPPPTTHSNTRQRCRGVLSRTGVATSGTASPTITEVDALAQALDRTAFEQGSAVAQDPYSAFANLIAAASRSRAPWGNYVYYSCFVFHQLCLIGCVFFFCQDPFLLVRLLLHPLGLRFRFLRYVCL